MIFPKHLIAAGAAVILSFLVQSGAHADFALRDRDTVVFLGDSITAARTYGKIIENYTLLRYPNRRVRFINAGWGGDTAEGGLKRLERDVFARGATVLTVAYGVNDIGWGTKADAEHKKRYLDSVRGIVAKCRERHVRVFICSAAITAEDPATAETGFLQRMCDEGMAAARSMGEHSIDIQRSMRAIQRTVRKAAEQSKDPKDKPAMHVADGVHLNDLGQLAMAFAILKGLGAPADVSSASLDARSQTTLAATGCRVSGLQGNLTHIEFDRLDDGLPINFGVFGALQFRFIPIPEELDQYLLTITNLADDKYDLLADNRRLGVFTSEQLAKGVNLCSATADAWEPGGPWDAEASALIPLTEARSNLADVVRQTDYYLPAFPAKTSVHSQADATVARIEALQRTLVKPRPFHFVVRPAKQ